MNCTTQYIETSKCLIREWSEEVAGTDVIALHLDIIDYIQKKKDILGAISDYTKTVEFKIAPEGLDGIVRVSVMLSRSLKEKSSLAIVVKTAEMHDIAEMYKKIATDTKWIIEIFTNREDAEKWLCCELGINSIYG